MIKKSLTKIFLILTLLTSSACVTDFLWGARDYREEITQFYVGADGRYVVLMGPQYHYVLTDNSGTLGDVLSLKQKGVISLDKESYLNLDDSNNLEGELILKGSMDLLPQGDMIRLQLLGFLPDRDDEVSIKLKLKGRRYSARYLSQQSPSQDLSDRYFITVFYRKNIGFIAGVGKAAVTPVAVTLDAALLIGKVAIYPFTLPYKKTGIR